MKRLASIALSVFGIIALIGCDDDGPLGPVDEAEVVSTTVVFDFDDASFNGPVASVQYDFPEITPSVVEGGAVLAYFRDQDTWTAMPFTVGVESPEVPAVDYTFTFGYAFDPGFLEVFVEASTDDQVVWEEILALLRSSYPVKVVIIDGFVLGKHSDLDWSDYEAVKERFGLRD